MSAGAGKFGVMVSDAGGMRPAYRSRSREPDLLRLCALQAKLEGYSIGRFWPLRTGRHAARHYDRA